MSYINTNLKIKSGKNIQYNENSIEPIKEEIVEFLNSENYMNNLKFSKKMMMSQEIKANNLIEGINDDLTLIDKVISTKKNLSDTDKNRIINLYHGYQYILTHSDIDKDGLKKLYSILSLGLLEEKFINKMGDYYRNGPVYIYDNNRIDSYPYEGIKPEFINSYMDSLFEYINNDNLKNNDSIEHFIKSQIIHFYFVYIHPYFDINGRTSRTTSMWYLLKNKSYPYIIFNRAIAFNQKGYEPSIIESKKYGDITKFLKYMLINVKHELEKEYVIHSIENASSSHLSHDNLQTLEYILTMNGGINAKTFIETYHRFNSKRKPNEIINEKLVPLIDKNIIIPTRETKKFITNTLPNYEFIINENLTSDVDKNKIKTLNLENYTKKTHS